MTSRRIQITLIAATIALLAASAHAHAGGHVLRIDEGGDIYVDLGARDGVGAGTRLVLYHVVVAKNPVTGETLRDRFPLGQLTVARAGEHLAVAVAPRDIAHRIAVGDQVELATSARVFVDPWQQTIEARAARRAATAGADTAPDGKKDTPRPPSERQRQAQRAVDAAEAATAAWQQTLGRAPAERIAVWEAYLSAHEDSPYAGEVTREIASLRQQMAAEESIRAQLADPAGRRAEIRAAQLAALLPEQDTSGPLVVDVPAAVYEGEALSLAFAVLAPGRVERAWLYYRGPDDEGFARVALRPDGDAYLRGAIPARAVRPPGIGYYVEIAGPGEDPETDTEPTAPRAVLGSQQDPRRIAVQPRVEESAPDLDDRSRITLLMDYVDFDGGLGGGFDQYLHAEVDFMYRFVKPIYAVRVGFGTLGGVGGPKDLIDSSPTNDCRDQNGDYGCRRVDYNYAYVELEHRFSEAVAILLRPQFGRGSNDLRMTNDDGRCDTADVEGCALFNDLGLRARLRIGDERATNLSLGVGLTQNVGTMFEAAYTWSVIPRFPVKLSAQVTDQPVPEDFGVRLITDIGWRALGWVYPSVRIAYQARDVDHSGFSGGIAANFDW